MHCGSGNGDRINDCGAGCVHIAGRCGNNRFNGATQVILHTRPPSIRVPATHPGSKPIPARLQLYVEMRLQPKPVIILGKKLTIRVVQPKHRVRPRPRYRIRTDIKQGWFLELEPVVGRGSNPNVLSFDCRSERYKQ